MLKRIIGCEKRKASCLFVIIAISQSNWFMVLTLHLSRSQYHCVWEDLSSGLELLYPFPVPLNPKVGRRSAEDINCSLFWLFKYWLKRHFVFHFCACVNRKTPALSIVTALCRTIQTPGTGANNVSQRLTQTLGQSDKVNVSNFRRSHWRDEGHPKH